MINLELYKIFYTVAEKRNITKASETLNISQPAITKHLKNLESQLGTPLFIRTKKGVILNEYGEKIFLKVKQALTLLDESEKEICNYNELNKGTIKIGISTTLTKKYLLKYIENFHRKFPHIIIDIYTDPTKDLIKMLKVGTIDFIIGKFPKNLDYDLNYDKLGQTEYIFVANKKYFIIDKLNLLELQNYPILLQRKPSNSHDSVEQYFKENHLKIKPTMNIASSNLLIDFICMGYGIGYVTKLYVENELKSNKLSIIKVNPAPEKIDFGIITLKNNIMTSICHKFTTYLKNDFDKE